MNITRDQSIFYFTNYKAANIVGTIACTNLATSNYLAGTEAPLMSFSKLIIDESKIQGKYFFRLAEDSPQIILSEPIKKKIEQAGLVGFTLIPVESASA